MNKEKKQKFTTMWEIEKPYNDRMDRKSGIIVGIANLAILTLGAVICSYAMSLGTMTLGRVLLFGYAVGVFAMFITFLITARYVKIRID